MTIGKTFGCVDSSLFREAVYADSCFKKIYIDVLCIKYVVLSLTYNISNTGGCTTNATLIPDATEGSYCSCNFNKS